MASIQKTAASCEVEEDEFEDFEEEEMVEEVEYEDYEEEMEEELYEEEEEEEEMEQVDEEEEDEKRVVEVQKVKKEEESVQDPVREEEKSVNPEQPSASEGSALQPTVVFPPFIQSVSDLEKLHSALSKFLYQWNSLNRSLYSITAAIVAHAPSQHDACSAEQEEDKDEHSGQGKEKDERSGQGKEKDERSGQGKEKDERSWAEVLCGEMQGRGLRKYVEFNISQVDRLRHEVPEALRRIPNPAKLVFEAIGKFYTQGNRAYNNNEPLVSQRRASILLLEFFVLSGRPTEESSVKREAKLGALLWWKRLVNEGLDSTSAVDSLGLILFLACFGIPRKFDYKDIYFLLQKCFMRKKSDLLRRSNILVENIPGVIKKLIGEEMYVEAAELSCCFGLNDTFPPLPLLSSSVVEITQIAKIERKQSRGSLKILREANLKQLASLKSVAKCIQVHKLDVRELNCVLIHGKIAKLEKLLAKDEKRLEIKDLKRKVEHLESYRKSETKSKESFPSTSEPSQSVPSQMIQDNKPEQSFPAQPLLPDSRLDNSGISAAGSNIKDYPYGWDRSYYEISAGHRSLGMEYPAAAAQHLYHPQASGYGNGGGIPGRNLYQFADTVIQHESQHGKINRSSNTSPGAAKFGHY